MTDLLGIEKNRRDAGIDHRGLQHADAGNLQIIDHIAGRKHRAACTFFFGCRIHELELHFGGREGHAIELEVAGLLDRAIGDRHMRDDGLRDIGLPDADDGHAVLRHPARVDQPGGNRERADRRRQIAAVAAPVDKGRIDRHLAEEIVDIMVGSAAFGDDHRLAGAGGRATHAIGLLAIRIGAADHAQQERIASLARHLGGGRKVVQSKEHALAGTTTQIGGRDPDLCGMGHGDPQEACLDDSRKSCAKRCRTPPAS